MEEGYNETLEVKDHPPASGVLPMSITGSQVLEKPEILEKTIHSPKIVEMVVRSPMIARKARAGQFVIVMADESGERVPLTIADFDRDRGTVTLVLMVVGTSTAKLSKFEVGDSLHALIGPLGKASEIEPFDTVIMIGGGLGAAPIYPIARAFHEAGTRVIMIQGSRSADLLFWSDRLWAVSDEYILTTDDGSTGRKTLVTEPLRELLEADRETKRIGCVYAIGPGPMMKFCSLTTDPFGVRTVVSLNSIMIDGTGMCGGCRVELKSKKTDGTETTITRFTCTDGPEFDGNAVLWDRFLARHRIYCEQEKCSLDRYVEKTGG